MSHSYIDNTLMRGEVVLYRSRPHWVIFFRPLAWFVFALLIFMFGPQFSYGHYRFAPHWPPLFILVGVLALVLAILFAISAVIGYYSSEYGVTNKRVLMKIGFIRRLSLEIFLQKIEGVKVYQNIPGRLLGYGSITISGVGGSRDPFDNIPDPLAFRRKIQEQTEVSAENDPRKK